MNPGIDSREEEAVRALLQKLHADLGVRVMQTQLQASLLLDDRRILSKGACMRAIRGRAHAARAEPHGRTGSLQPPTHRPQLGPQLPPQAAAAGAASGVNISPTHPTPASAQLSAATPPPKFQFDGSPALSPQQTVQLQNLMNVRRRLKRLGFYLASMCASVMTVSAFSLYLIASHEPDSGVRINNTRNTYMHDCITVQLV